MPMKRIAVLQPGYIPWLGFFDLIYRSDTFVILDDVQYTVRDWRGRNRIKTSNGITWLTVPVRAKGGVFQRSPVYKRETRSAPPTDASYTQGFRDRLRL